MKWSNAIVIIAVLGLIGFVSNAVISCAESIQQPKTLTIGDVLDMGFPIAPIAKEGEHFTVEIYGEANGIQHHIIDFHQSLNEPGAYFTGTELWIYTENVDGIGPTLSDQRPSK